MNEHPMVYFSHGKESGPWGTKITYLAQQAEALGLPVASIDYRASSDPEWRIAHLLASVVSHPCILVGSSMGAYVATAAAEQLQPLGLFLMAPAFYLPGYERYAPEAPPCPTTIVHGWNDDVVPADNAIRFARQTHCSLHLIDSDHGLNDSLPLLGGLFQQFLGTLDTGIVNASLEPH